MAGSVQTRILRRQCWKLLCNTKTLGMCMMPGAEEVSIEISAYASSAPGGRKVKSSGDAVWSGGAL
eukprot:12924926-Prorocentrum_lima.AAC.1